MLVLTDGAKWRWQERKAYAQRSAELDRETRRLRRFEEDELPGFQLWVEMTFADDLVDLRAAEREVERLQKMINEVRTYAGATGVSERRAYEIIGQALANGTYEALLEDLLNQMDDEERDAASSGFDDPCEDFGGEESCGRTDSTENENEARSEPTGAVSSYLKGLYRKLVRALHPDLRETYNREAEALWHEVQNAYDWADVQTLERLYKSVVKEQDQVAEFSFDTAPIGDIATLRQGIEARLTEIRQRLSSLQGHPAWDFGRIRKNVKRCRHLASQIGDDLEHDILVAGHEKAKLEKLMARWERRPPKPKKTFRRRRDIEE